MSMSLRIAIVAAVALMEAATLAFVGPRFLQRGQALVLPAVVTSAAMSVVAVAVVLLFVVE